MKNNVSLEIIKLLNDDADKIIEKTPINKIIKRALKLKNDKTKLKEFIEYGKFDEDLHFTTKNNYVTYYLILSTMSAEQFLDGANKKFVGSFSTEVEDKLTEYTYSLTVNNGVVEIETIKTVDSVENAKLHYEPKQVTTTILNEQEVGKIFGTTLSLQLIIFIHINF